MSNKKTNSVPLLPENEEDAFVQNVWQQTYSACLGALLAPSIVLPQEDKFLVRNIHRALHLADTAKQAARSYIEQRKKQAQEEEAAKAGDPLSKLVSPE